MSCLGDARRAAWFQPLSPPNHAAVEDVIPIATQYAIFFVLSEFDGVGGPPGPPDGGRYEIRYRKGAETGLKLCLLRVARHTN